MNLKYFYRLEHGVVLMSLTVSTLKYCL